MFSDSGWINADLTKKWLQWVYKQPQIDEQVPREGSMLIWDSFRCHMENEVTSVLKQMNIDSMIIPGGCTSKIQTLDVSINHPFKMYV